MKQYQNYKTLDDMKQGKIVVEKCDTMTSIRRDIKKTKFELERKYDGIMKKRIKDGITEFYDPTQLPSFRLAKGLDVMEKAHDSDEEES